MELGSAHKDKSSIFKVRSVRVKVHSLKFSIHGSKRDYLYKTLRPLATVLIKRQIQKAVADAIKTGLEYVDGQLVSVRDRMDEARASSDTSRTDVLRAAFQRKKEEAEVSTVSEKGSERKSQFKVVAKRDSAILPQHGHESGWATKAQERAEAAGTGESWHSDAYVSYPVLPSPSNDMTVAQVHGRLSHFTFKRDWSFGYVMSGAYSTSFNNRRCIEFSFLAHVGHSMSICCLYFIPFRYNYVCFVCAICVKDG